MNEKDRLVEELDGAKAGLGQWRMDTVQRMVAVGISQQEIVAALLSALAWELCIGAVIFGYRPEDIHEAVDTALEDDRLEQFRKGEVKQ